MMIAMRGAAIALFAVSLACSGSTERDPVGAGGTSGAAGAGAGGAAGNPAGGTAGGGAGCAGTTEYDCVPSWCGGDAFSARVCSNGSWVCPEGQVPSDQCPDDTCFHPTVIWCCDALGTATKPTCPGQASEVCPPGTLMNMSVGSSCPPAGTFTCGSEVTCKLGQEYCLRMDGPTTKWSCEPLPPACVADATCACLQAQACAGTCDDDGIGALKCFD